MQYRSTRWLAALGFLALSCVEKTGPASLPERLWGITVDSTEELDATLESIRALPVKPITRLVFDPGYSAEDYAPAVARLHQSSYVMGELLDSWGMRDVSRSEYAARAREYLDRLGTDVDLWEVGNEVNGEWLGETADVVAKVQSAYDAVKERGALAAITLFYNRNCWSDPEHEMFAWTGRNLPRAVREGVDYLFISYYEDGCQSFAPDWNDVFSRLRALFPAARLGFGEVGTPIAAHKEDFVRRFYGLGLDFPGYVGGYFWWYFRQDMVPSTRPLLRVLGDAISSHR
jgi:hypothetical protein